MNNTPSTPTADVLAIGTYYIATNYGIHPDNDASTNTTNFQELVKQVSSNGGGTIYFPVGTYCFGIGDTLVRNQTTIPYAISMKSNVSIIGENMEKTVLKQISETSTDDNGNEIPNPYSLFVYLNPENEPTKINGVITHPETFVPITGCTYSNFTVDASETYAIFECNEDGSVKNSDDYPYYAKAFYYQFLKDCVFRDLILRDTIATALGIDYLDRVQIENVHCYNCGRGYVKGATGSAGIGIGTGGWDNENFYIHNCTCVESGQFGIFIENQLYLGWGPKHGSTLARGCIISNCIARNGRNKGIGIRGGRDVIVTGCEAYENDSDGFYIDGKCQNVKIDGCNSSFNKANGIYVKPSKKGGNAPSSVTETSYRIIVSNSTFEGNSFDGINAAPESTLSTLVLKDNVLLSNALKGIRLANGFTAPVIMGNYVSHNGPGLSIDAATYQDCVIKDNVIRNAVENGGNFTGFNDENELLKGRGTVIRIPYSSFTKGIKILGNGTEDTNSTYFNSDACMSSDYIDISDFPNNFFVSFSHNIDSIRIAHYNSSKNTLHTDANPTGMLSLWNNGICNHVINVAKLANTKYIRICISYKSFYSNDNSNFSVVIAK